eukprot:scaffold1182_cov165-Amphora_coffeaeformis.AAC.5
MERLQGNLMRSQQSRDPMLIYEVMEIMGEGSMGSVSRVRKRIEAVGGSARAAFVQKHGGAGGRVKCCFGWLDFLKLPSQKNLMDSSRTDDTTTTSDASGKRTRSRSTTTTAKNNRKMYRQQSSLVTYDVHKEAFYALKSIHLDRCSNKEYIDELKVLLTDHSPPPTTKWFFLGTRVIYCYRYETLVQTEQNEVAILRNIDHPNIVRAIETFDFKDRLYMVLELCSGGDLYTREPYTEGAAQSIVKSLFSAISYMHSRGIVHRDVS